MQAWIGSLAALVVTTALAAASAQPGDQMRAQARLVSEKVALSPGQTNYLGLTFEIEDGWHIYWQGLNDTGMPVTISLNLPPGYSQGEVQWPAPKRYISPGDILDHVYEGTVTLVIPVNVPQEASGKARFTGSAEWLVCKEACIMEDSQISLILPVSASDAVKPSRDAELFAKARETIPTPLPKEDPPIAFHLDGDTYEIRSKLGTQLAFFPAEDTAALKSPLRDAASKTGVLRLALDDLSPGKRLKGVIELKRDDGGKPVYHTVELPIADVSTPLTSPRSR